MTRTYLSPPDVGPDDLAAIERAFNQGWIAPLGPEVDAFEEELASKTGRTHCVVLSSGTAAPSSRSGLEGHRRRSRGSRIDLDLLGDPERNQVAIR